MASVKKALTRPATIKGVPAKPFICLVMVAIFLGFFVKWWLAVIVAGLLYEMHKRGMQDSRFMSLPALRAKVFGLASLLGIKTPFDKQAGASCIGAVKYDSVDVEEFVKSMRLNQRVNIGKFIPFSTHMDRHIVRNKRGDFVFTWEIGGTIFECESEEDLKLIGDSFHTFIRSHEGHPITFYTHRVGEGVEASFTADSGIEFSDTVVGMYYAAMKEKTFRQTRIFFTACYNPGTSDVTEGLRRAQDYWRSINIALRGLRVEPEPLGVFEEGGRAYSSQLSFYNFLLTCQWQKILVTNTPVHDVLCGADIFFSADTAQVRTGSGSKFFKGIEVKDWCPETCYGIFDCLMLSTCDYVLTQSYECMAKPAAKKGMKDQANIMKSTEDDAKSESAVLEEAKDDLQSGRMAMGRYHLSLIVKGDSLDHVQEATDNINTAFTDLGIVTSQCNESLGAAYVAQLPGNYKYRPHVVMMGSDNYAEMCAFHNFSTHKRDGNPWGEAIAITETPSQGLQYLNLHNSQMGSDDFKEINAGNTMILGSTGVGKSTFLMMLTHFMQKYRKQSTFAPDVLPAQKRFTTVVFDKDRSAEMSIRAQGGAYFRFESGKPTGLAPADVDLTTGKRRRIINNLKRLLRMLCTRDGQRITDFQQTELSNAVETIMRLPREKRGRFITAVLSVLPEEPTKENAENGLRIRLERWKHGGEFGWVFDNEKDEFDIQNIDNFGIDGTEFLDDEDVRSPLTFYLLYRVSLLQDGRRIAIMMDEFWKWLQDGEFSKFALNMLKVIRKYNGIFIMATQSPEEMFKHEISSAIIEQCSTRILMSNSKANRADYVDKMKVSEPVFEIVKNLNPSERCFVITKSPLRRGDIQGYSAIAKLDLSSLGPYTRLLSGSMDNVKIFDDHWKPGMSPADWVPRILPLLS